MISVLNYGLGNLKSLQNALEFLHIRYKIISNYREIYGSHKIILPGVGSFAKGMENIKKSSYLEPLREVVLEKKVPILGICLGFQLLAEESEEDGFNEGLKFIKGKVLKFSFLDKFLKIPHIGFNAVYFKKKLLYDGLGSKSYFYFVHSYRVVDCQDEIVSGVCSYGEDFIASIEKDNIFGVQFHPEKSQSNGLRVLLNFANL